MRMTEPAVRLPIAPPPLAQLIGPEAVHIPGHAHTVVSMNFCRENS